MYMYIKFITLITYTVISTGFKVSPCTDLLTNCLKENAKFMIFEMEFNSEIFTTQGEYFKLLISEKISK